VLANFSGEPTTIEVPDADRWQYAELLLANYPPDDAVDFRRLALRPWEALVYRTRSPLGSTEDDLVTSPS
jgi:hypothetical protein